MSPINDELLDLLTERALGELSPAELKRLDELLAEADLDSEEEIELAIAAAMNAFAGANGADQRIQVPDSLRQTLHDDADRFFGGRKAPEDRTGNTVTDLETARARRDRERSTAVSAPSWSGRLGWAVAAMLAVVVAVTMRPDLQPGAQPEPLDPASARTALIAEAETSVLEWNPSDIPTYNAVSGDVVWNDERQEGYLRLAGMPMNDPAISQYQLWIVDPDRDANPVDGGVFDVPPGSDEVIIPINAKLGVSKPAAFAISREQPGGVVVSDGPLLIVAST